MYVESLEGVLTNFVAKFSDLENLLLLFCYIIIIIIIMVIFKCYFSGELIALS